MNILYCPVTGVVLVRPGADRVLFCAPGSPPGPGGAGPGVGAFVRGRRRGPVLSGHVQRRIYHPGFLAHPHRRLDRPGGGRAGDGVAGGEGHPPQRVGPPGRPPGRAGRADPADRSWRTPGPGPIPPGRRTPRPPLGWRKMCPPPRKTGRTGEKKTGVLRHTRLPSSKRIFDKLSPRLRCSRGLAVFFFGGDGLTGRLPCRRSKPSCCPPGSGPCAHPARCGWPRSSAPRW